MTSSEPVVTFIPATDRQLEEVLDHAHLVEDLGTAGAPGAAYAVALLAPALVFELRLFRADATTPTSATTLSEQLWKDRADRAENRCRMLAADAQQLPRLRAAAEEILQQLADERGTREALDRRVAELKADLERERRAWDERGREIDRLNAALDERGELLRRWYRADGTAETLPTAAEVILRRVRVAQRLQELEELATGGVAVGAKARGAA